MDRLTHLIGSTLSRTIDAAAGRVQGGSEGVELVRVTRNQVYLKTQGEEGMDEYKDRNDRDAACAYTGVCD
jgi:hypothetical protein